MTGVPMPDFKSPIYNDEDKAREHLEKLQWPNGPVCPHCGSFENITKLQGKSTRPGVYKCNDCRSPFSVTVGTVFERSKIPLTKWLLATDLLCSSKKGMSAHQLHRMLGVTYKTAWFMAHRIREAMAPSQSESGPIGGEGVTVEADETFIGKKDGKRKAKGAGGYGHKRTVMSLIERGGKTRSFHLDSTKQVKGVLYEHLDPASTLHTDGAQHYKLSPAAKHEAVDHSKTYVSETGAHTNTAESFFSVFKRGMVGTYQHCGSQHLQRYLAEFDFRMNTRTKLGFNDTMRAEIALKGIEGKRLTYRRTGSAQEHSSEG